MLYLLRVQEEKLTQKLIIKTFESLIALLLWELSKNKYKLKDDCDMLIGFKGLLVERRDILFDFFPSRKRA